MKFSISLAFLIVYISVCHTANGNGFLGSECSTQNDCNFPLSCLALNDKEIYSLFGVVRPALVCETSSNSGKCMCSQPGIITEQCDAISFCDSSKTCLKATDCSSGQFCFQYTPDTNVLGPEPCSAGDSSCTCATPDKSTFDSCSRSSDCPAGARCAKLEELYSSKCVSCELRPELEVTILEYAEQDVPKNCEATPDQSPVAPPSPPSPASVATSPSPTNDGATADREPTVTPEPGFSSAGISTPNPSTSSPETTIPASTSDPSTGGISDGSDNNVCIDVKALESFVSGELVFSQHRRASVLCDSYGSCATAGHMVTFQDVPMTMMTYCSSHAEGGCTKTIKFVNSPRMKAGLRIPSSTKAMEFTSLSAKYQTRTEEWLLSKLLRFWA